MIRKIVKVSVAMALVVAVFGLAGCRTDYEVERTKLPSIDTKETIKEPVKTPGK